MRLLLRDNGTNSKFSCTFDIPANAPLRPYALRGLTPQAWQKIRLEVLDLSPDGQAAILVDNADVQYKPGLTPVGVECDAPPNPPPNVNLVMNPDFSADETVWRFPGDLNHSVVGEVMQMYRDVDSPVGILAQVLGDPVESGQPLAATVEIGNNSGVDKRVRLRLIDNGTTNLLACRVRHPGQRAAAALRAARPDTPGLEQAARGADGFVSGRPGGVAGG